MFFIVIGKLTDCKQDVNHPFSFIGADKEALIEKAIATKKEWESKSCNGTPYGPYQIWLGEIVSSIEPIKPVVQFREVPIS